MDDILNENGPLFARIHQLEHERDELRKDIEQLCIQQAGPSYLVVATKMHFQRTAALEQEIEILKNKLATFTRENSNLQEELSEAYRIKSQLADLHGAEVLKNIDAEKQIKFFQGCVAAAFAERDHSIMEAEKAKEKEELLAYRLNDLPNRVDELTSECDEQKLRNEILQTGLAKQEEQNITFIKSALEEELEKVRKSADNLQNKLHMGLEIENHLKKKVYGLEKRIILYGKMVKKGVSELVNLHCQHRLQILNLLDREKYHLRSIIDMIEQKFRQHDRRRNQNLVPPQRDARVDENECRDVHIAIDVDPILVDEVNDPVLPERSRDGTNDASKALAQALHEKVAAILLLSQQEERHMLERNVNDVLQKKMDELQKNLLQVTNEKVRALMEMAQLKQEKQILQEKIGGEMRLTAIEEKRNLTPERDGRLKNMLKKSYLKRWIGSLDSFGNGADASRMEGNTSGNSSIDFARLQIENATLKENTEGMEHLTSSIHRLRLSLEKARLFEGDINNISETLDEIINEAKLVKTALGSSLPVSWSAEAEDETLSEGLEFEPNEKIDSVCAAGFEMVELLILAAQILKDKNRKSNLDNGT